MYTRVKNQGERVMEHPVTKHMESWNHTIAGTAKKKNIPSVLAAKWTRDQYPTIFGFRENHLTMRSYLPKKTKLSFYYGQCIHIH